MQSNRIPSARRGFLASLAAGAGAAAAAPFALRRAPAAVAMPGTVSGYRLTAHIRRFYERANL